MPSIDNKIYEKLSLYIVTQIGLQKTKPFPAKGSFKSLGTQQPWGHLSSSNGLLLAWSAKCAAMFISSLLTLSKMTEEDAATYPRPLGQSRKLQRAAFTSWPPRATHATPPVPLATIGLQPPPNQLGCWVLHIEPPHLWKCWLELPYPLVSLLTRIYTRVVHKEFTQGMCRSTDFTRRV